jgi:AraC-like DNA-binding protein
LSERLPQPEDALPASPHDLVARSSASSHHVACGGTLPSVPAAERGIKSIESCGRSATTVRQGKFACARQPGISGPLFSSTSPFSPVIFEYPASLVARTGVDHLMLTMYLAGTCAFTVGRRAITARPGDILVIDYSEPSVSRSHSDDGSTHVVNLLLPALDLRRRELLSSIKAHVEQNLVVPEIGVDHLCGRFGLSRSALYRLFEPEGGLAAYIQQRRLIRAYARLTAPEMRDRRIIDVALESQFASDATFARAFRRQFGITPREVRALAAEQDLREARWLRELR